MKYTWTLAAALTLLLSTAAHAAAEDGGSPSVFAGTIMQSLAAIIVFLVLLAVLYRYAWGPILTGLQDREGKIRDDLEQAERARAEAKQTLEQYKAQLAEARKEAQTLIEQSRADAQKVGAELKQQTHNEITQMRQRATNDIRVAKEQAMAEIYEQTATLATQVAGRILKREINPADQRALVEASLAELSRSQTVN